MRYAFLAAMLMAGCSSSPTAPTATVPPIPGTQVPAGLRDGRFRGAVTPEVTAELTIDTVRGHTFRIITNQNVICLNAGDVITGPITFTPRAGTLGCYTRDQGRNNDHYLQFCVLSNERVEGTFWMNPGVNYWADRCINGPLPPPASAQAPIGGSFAFAMTRQ